MSTPGKSSWIWIQKNVILLSTTGPRSGMLPASARVTMRTTTENPTPKVKFVNLLKQQRSFIFCIDIHVFVRAE